jgi:hypothetical protein
MADESSSVAVADSRQAVLIQQEIAADALQGARLTGLARAVAEAPGGPFGRAVCRIHPPLATSAVEHGNSTVGQSCGALDVVESDGTSR